MFFNVFISFNLLTLLLNSTLQLIPHFHINPLVNFIVGFYQQFMTKFNNSIFTQQLFETIINNAF